jgi:hypothetical protein
VKLSLRSAGTGDRHMHLVCRYCDFFSPSGLDFFGSCPSMLGRSRPSSLTDDGQIQLLRAVRPTGRRKSAAELGVTRGRIELPYLASSVPRGAVGGTFPSLFCTNQASIYHRTSPQSSIIIPMPSISEENSFLGSLHGSSSENPFFH